MKQRHVARLSVLFISLGLLVAGALLAQSLDGTPETDLGRTLESQGEEAWRFQDPEPGDGPSIVIELPNTTQGPFWPPSEVMDEDGNFVVIGSLLTEVAPGVIFPIHGAAIVSADTTPPLNQDGVEDFSNPFGAPYEIVRMLDLSRGSSDLNMKLYTSSFGPAVGNFGGGPRIPAEGESRYNLNMLPPPCPENFPATSQAAVYQLPSYPLNHAPIWGFRGDQVAYDVETGKAYEPNLAAGADCFPEACSGEEIIDFRATGHVTLRQWLRARSQVKITLTQFDETAGGYTHARFELRFRRLFPHSLYTVWAIRAATFIDGTLPDPITIPGLLIANDQGRGSLTAELENPFPIGGPEFPKRIVGLALAFHPDHQTWGACSARLGVGVDVNGVFNSLTDGTLDITPFVTVEPSN